MDAVTFQVVQSRLSGIVQEMQEHIFRTGYSTIIRESQDASCMIMDAQGHVVGEHVVLPLHVACLPEVVRGVRRTFGDAIAAGDAFITNHPYLGGVPHSMDMALITPVFHAGTLVAFCGSIAHKSDLGGVVAGTAYGNARELFQEGIQYPPVRYARGGEIVHDVDAILRANSRTPELVTGDLRGQLGVARLGERRLAETFARYGLNASLATFAHKQDTTEARIRAELALWPDGAFEAETMIDSDGISLDRPVRYHVRVEKRGDRLMFDFRESGDQAEGPINLRPPLVRGCCYYALIATIDPSLGNNGGVARVVETQFRRGSLLDPHFPAACNTYMPSTLAVTEIVLRALSGFVPERRMAGVGGADSTSIGGRRDDGSTFLQYELMGSAYGGRASKDGVSGTAVLISNARSAPIEVIESEFPTRIRRFELIPDSGGPGQHRGGLAPRREYEIVADEAQLMLRGGRHVHPAFGRDGGEPGRVASATLHAQGAPPVSLPSRFSGRQLLRGDRVTFDKAGGGGFGDPHRRPVDRVVGDVLDGYVSRDAAIERYGADPADVDAALAAWLRDA